MCVCVCIRNTYFKVTIFPASYWEYLWRDNPLSEHAYFTYIIILSYPICTYSPYY